MLNTAHIRLSHNSVHRRLQQPEQVTTVRSVWQDNPAPPRERIATPQPGAVPQDPRSQQKTSTPQRSQKKPIPKHRTEQLILWVHPLVKAEIQRIAKREGLSISKVGATFLEQAVQQNLHTQHEALLDPIIEKAIGKHMRSYSSRIALLLVRVAFASEQTRSIVTNILSRHPGVNQSVLSDILNGSSNAAKRNITRKTPQLESILTEVEQWFTQAQMSL